MLIIFRIIGNARLRKVLVTAIKKACIKLILLGLYLTYGDSEMIQKMTSDEWYLMNRIIPIFWQVNVSRKLLPISSNPELTGSNIVRIDEVIDLTKINYSDETIIPHYIAKEMSSLEDERTMMRLWCGAGNTISYKPDSKEYGCMIKAVDEAIELLVLDGLSRWLKYDLILNEKHLVNLQKSKNKEYYSVKALLNGGNIYGTPHPERLGGMSGLILPSIYIKNIRSEEHTSELQSQR